MGCKNDEQDNRKEPQDMMQGNIIGKIRPGSKNVGFQITPEQNYKEKKEWSEKTYFELSFFEFMFDGFDKIYQGHTYSLYVSILN
jgi:hypothetical protein